MTLSFCSVDAAVESYGALISAGFRHAVAMRAVFACPGNFDEQVDYCERAAGK